MKRVIRAPVEYNPEYYKEYDEYPADLDGYIEEVVYMCYHNMYEDWYNQDLTTDDVMESIYNHLFYVDNGGALLDTKENRKIVKPIVNKYFHQYFE